MRTQPPRLALWLLTRRLPRYWRDFVIGDLTEEFARRQAASSADARRWFWRQTVRCAAAPPATPLQHRPVRIPHGDSLMRRFLDDFWYAGRVLRRAPAFALAAAGVLALGIGANTAIFSIVNTVLLRPLPFADSEGLVRLHHTPPQSTFPGITRFPLSPANFYDWQTSAQHIERMAMYRFRGFAMTGRGEAESVLASAVGPGFFQILRVQPLLGRAFLDAEDEPGRSRVAIVSDGFWKRRLGGDANVLGQTLTLNSEAYTIVGVVRAEPTWFPTGRDLFVPIALSTEERAVRENHNQRVIARLAPGATVAQAQAELDVISTRLESQYPKDNAGWGAVVVPMREDIVGDSRASLLVLLAAVALVLLIACANVGNLLFARALSRRKELAIRAALGARRGQVFQQLIVEALLLALVGGLGGLLIASGSLASARTLLADRLPRASEISVDGTVLLFVAGVSILTGVLAGAVPALRAGRADLNEVLKEGGRNDGAVGLNTRRLLVACEVALSVVLLMGAAVMVRSLVALQNVDGGYDPRQVLTFNVALPDSRYQAPERRRFFDAALERLRALPSVTAVGAIDSVPMMGGSIQPIVLEGKPELLPRDQPTVQVRQILPGYLSSMRIPVLRGRDFAASDLQGLLVSRSAARLLWGSDDPIGRRITLPLESRMVFKTVVGIVGDVKGDLAEEAQPTVYQYSRDHNFTFMNLTVRSAGDPATLTRAAITALRAVDPQLPIEGRSMESFLDEALAPRRFNALVLALFAVVALTLATVGIYSVLAYVVRGRSREIGIRTALGAQVRDVLRLVVIEGMRPALIGIAAGAIAALGAATVLDRLVFGVSASDPLTLASVAGLLALVALAASLVPAYRAARLDPLKVLRDD